MWPTGWTKIYTCILFNKSCKSFFLLFFLLLHCYFFSCYFFSCYFFSCYFFSYFPTVTFFPVTFFPVTFFPVTFFPLLFFLLLSFLQPSEWSQLFEFGVLCAACWAHFMCLRKLWPISVIHHFSFLNNSLDLAAGNFYQKLSSLFWLIFQNFFFSRSLSIFCAILNCFHFFW